MLYQHRQKNKCLYETADESITVLLCYVAQDRRRWVTISGSICRGIPTTPGHHGFFKMTNCFTKLQQLKVITNNRLAHVFWKVNRNDSMFNDLTQPIKCLSLLNDCYRTWRKNPFLQHTATRSSHEINSRHTETLVSRGQQQQIVYQCSQYTKVFFMITS